VAPDCPIWHRTVRCSKTTNAFNDQLLRTLTNVLTWHARTVNSDCPVAHRTVWCVHHQQPLPTARKWLGGYKYPQPPHSLVSKFSEVHIQYKSSSIHSKTQFQRSNPLQVPNSSQPLSYLRKRAFLCSFALLSLGLPFESRLEGG
jgi:hypothetical protein